MSRHKPCAVLLFSQAQAEAGLQGLHGFLVAAFRTGIAVAPPTLRRGLARLKIHAFGRCSAKDVCSEILEEQRVSLGDIGFP